MSERRTRSEVRLGAAASPDARGRIDVRIDGNEAGRPIYFQSGDVDLAPSNEAALTSAILPAMLWNQNIVVEGPASRRFLENLDRIEDIYHCWDARLQKVQVRGATPVVRERRGERVGLFFSGGVDSFYSLLKHQDEVTDLIFIHGFDIGVGDRSRLQGIGEVVRRAGERLGKRVVEVATDLRSLLEGQALSWRRLGGGPVKAAIGHVLGAEFKRIYIAAAETYAILVPWGGHPLLDPMWGTEALEFRRDGGESTRPEKVGRLVAHDWIVESLRVCWRPTADGLNCGRCEKCMRTMLILESFGALERCPTFAADLEPQRVARIHYRGVYFLDGAREVLEALERSGRARALARALRRALTRSERSVVVSALLETYSPRAASSFRRLDRQSRRDDSLA